MTKKIRALHNFNECIRTYGFEHKKTIKAAKKYQKISDRLAKKENK